MQGQCETITRAGNKKMSQVHWDGSLDKKSISTDYHNKVAMQYTCLCVAIRATITHLSTLVVGQHVRFLNAPVL